MRYLLDTWAWVSYFDGSKAGAKVKDILDAAEVATSIVSVAELSDLHARTKAPELDERLEFMRSCGRILEVNLEVAKKAGETKWAQRARKRPMGIGDALIYETAKTHGLTVLTGDAGFEGLPGVEFMDGQ